MDILTFSIRTHRRMLFVLYLQVPAYLYVCFVRSPSSHPAGGIEGQFTKIYCAIDVVEIDAEKGDAF